MENEIIIQNQDYEKLIEAVGSELKKGRQNIAFAVNAEIVLTYWHIGQHIIEYEQNGNERAEYGSDLLNRLSRDLTKKYGAGFSRSNVFYIRKLYMEYQKVQTLSELSWSHYIELLKIEDKAERAFYEKESKNSHWGVRELKRQMKSMLYHRLALSTDKNEIIRLSREGQVIEKAEDILKEPYVFEFTGLPQLPVYKEGDLEEALVKNLGDFLLELGKGFAYMGREYRLQIGNTEQFLDMLFYNTNLRCYVVIEIKTGQFEAANIGQLGTYVTAVNHILKTENDNPTLGLLICKEKDNVLAKFSLESSKEPLAISEYELSKLYPADFKSALPTIQEIESGIMELMEKDNGADK